MTKWLRLNVDAIRHPKVARLSHFDFRIWVELLSLAALKDGAIPCLDDVVSTLRRRRVDVESAMSRLSFAGLLDVIEGGWTPHNWEKYQMKSDRSTERVRKWRSERNAFRNVSETAHETKRYETIHNKENTKLRLEKKSPQKKVSKRTQLEEDHVPDERDVEIASRAGMSAITLDFEWQRFRAYHMAKGSLMANWTQAWVTWVTNWKGFGAKQAQPGLNGASGSKYDWSKELAELERERNHGNEENRRTH